MLQLANSAAKPCNLEAMLLFTNMPNTFAKSGQKPDDSKRQCYCHDPKLRQIAKLGDMLLFLRVP